MSCIAFGGSRRTAKVDRQLTISNMQRSASEAIAQNSQDSLDLLMTKSPSTGSISRKQASSTKTLSKAQERAWLKSQTAFQHVRNATPWRCDRQAPSRGNRKKQLNVIPAWTRQHIKQPSFAITIPPVQPNQKGNESGLR